MDAETAGLPSQKGRDALRAKEAKAAQIAAMLQDANMEDAEFDPVKFLSGYQENEDGVCEEWDSPSAAPVEEEDEHPPKIARFSADDFAAESTTA